MGRASTPTDRPHHTLLLTNGELLTGRVCRQVDTIVVVTDRGAELRLPDRDISRFCRDKQDALSYLRRAVNRSNCDDVLEMAEWALRQGMLDECATELAAARKLSPAHPALDNLIERLRQARLGPYRHSPEPAKVAVARGRDPLPIPQTRFAQLPAHDRAILASFTKSLQPLLANQCATAGCHGPGNASDLTIRRPIRGRGFTSAQSIANLQATLQYVNRDSPMSSQLLTAFRDAEIHGRLLSDPRNSPVEKLEVWLQSLSSSPPGQDIEADQDARTPSEEVAAVNVAEVMTVSHGATQSPSESKPTITSSQVSDPYDPDVFNDGV